MKTRGLSRAYDDDYALVDLSSISAATITAVLAPMVQASPPCELFEYTGPTNRRHHSLDGQPVSAQDAHARKHIGYVGHQVMLYGALTARENLHFSPECTGLIV